MSSLTIDRSLRALDLPVDHGALVQSVQRGSPADKAKVKGGDIEAQLSNGTPVQIGGDIITKVDGKDVATSDDLATAVENHKPGDQVTLEVLSGKSKRDVKVTLGKRPASLDQTVPGG